VNANVSTECWKWRASETDLRIALAPIRELESSLTYVQSSFQGTSLRIQQQFKDLNNELFAQVIQETLQSTNLVRYDSSQNKVLAYQTLLLQNTTFRCSTPSSQIFPDFELSWPSQLISAPTFLITGQSVLGTNISLQCGLQGNQSISPPTLFCQTTNNSVVVASVNETLFTGTEFTLDVENVALYLCIDDRPLTPPSSQNISLRGIETQWENSLTNSTQNLTNATNAATDALNLARAILQNLTNSNQQELLLGPRFDELKALQGQIKLSIDSIPWESLEASLQQQGDLVDNLTSQIDRKTTWPRLGPEEWGCVGDTITMLDSDNSILDKKLKMLQNTYIHNLKIQEWYNEVDRTTDQIFNQEYPNGKTFSPAQFFRAGNTFGNFKSGNPIRAIVMMSIGFPFGFIVYVILVSSCIGCHLCCCPKRLTIHPKTHKIKSPPDTPINSSSKETDPLLPQTGGVPLDPQQI
jgi:hypothetical protein